MSRIKKIWSAVTRSRKQVNPPFVRDGKYYSLDKKIYSDYNAFRPEGPKALFCYVPFSNMTFSFKGRVLACAYNQKVVLGNYPQQSIREMWFESEMGNQLREHMSHNDLEYGCKHCKYFVEHRKFSGLKPLVFDKYADSIGSQFPKVMEFELANTCNFECVMCNGEVSSSIRKNRDKLPALKSPYDDAFVEQLREFVPHLKEAKFYGGEPFYIPIYFKIWKLIHELNPAIKLFVITNGSILTDQVKEVLEKGNFDIGVSMDATNKELLEGIRKNVEQEVLLKNIQYYNDYCKRKGKKLVISFTMMRLNYKEFPKVINYCNSIDAILYVSYLKTPPRFAIWNLPAETLKDIRREMESFHFPSGTVSEKNNIRCFQDFLSYLDQTIIENQTRPIEEIIPFGQEDEADLLTQIEYNPTEDYKTALLEKLDIDPKRKKSFFDKIEQSSVGISEDKSINKVFFSMLHTPQEELVSNVEEYSVEKLHQLINSVISPKNAGNN